MARAPDPADRAHAIYCGCRDCSGPEDRWILAAMILIPVAFVVAGLISFFS